MVVRERLRGTKGRFIAADGVQSARTIKRNLTLNQERSKEREWYRLRQLNRGRVVVPKPDYSPEERLSAQRQAHHAWTQRNKDFLKNRDLQLYHSVRKLSPAFKAQKSAYDKQYRKRERVKRKAWSDAFRERMKDNIQFRIAVRLRSRVRMAVKRSYGNKAARTMDLIGCSVERLKVHLESQFTEGMSWEAFMRGEIHIDHKLPCACFDLKLPEEQRKCFSWLNLQPLWERDNLSKGDKIIFSK